MSKLNILVLTPWNMLSSEITFPRILKVCTKRRSEVSFTLRTLFSPENGPLSPKQGAGLALCRFGFLGEEMNSHSCKFIL
jgi:hypothetical protein